MKRLLVISLACLAMVPMTAMARSGFGVFMGPRFMGPRMAPFGFYGGFYGGGPYMYPYGGFGYPYGGYGYPYGYGGTVYNTPQTGKVKFQTSVKDAEVYVNGSYAGTVGGLKTMTLDPGDYQIEIRAPQANPYDQDVYVTAGKTVTIHPDFNYPAPAQSAPAPTN